jgi:hypothetical protein
MHAGSAKVAYGIRTDMPLPSESFDPSTKKKSEPDEAGVVYLAIGDR